MPLCHFQAQLSFCATKVGNFVLFSKRDGGASRGVTLSFESARTLKNKVEFNSVKFPKIRRSDVGLPGLEHKNGRMRRRCRKICVFYFHWLVARRAIFLEDLIGRSDSEYREGKEEWNRLNSPKT